ncbi:hypothetical protein [Oceanobacillus massiliensis]|uniref:hypothetical protein n=1 Tax=Oceanobacillus massiliensis TaxID=1465765 RepID=UPI0030186FC0
MLKLKKLSLALMIAILSAGMLAGCGDGEENPEEPATEDPAEQEDTEETDDVEEEE